ncbi:unnamed protein product [Ectocarpus sp. 12 AP-2014]
MAVCMRTWRYYVLPLLGCFIGGLASILQGAFDQIVSHHAKDLRALNRTLDSLTNIAENLFNEPENPKYRKIRLLNKVVWERVGSVDGGISFMSALGFDLNPGTGDGPCFQARTGAPVETDVRQALDLLSARCLHQSESGKPAAEAEPREASGFNPFTTAFSRKSRTRLQERAEQGLAHLSDSQAKRQQRFSTLEERQVTILLPQQQHEASAETEEQEEDGEQGEADAEQRELELVAQLWRERMGNDEVERFETRAAKKLRLLRTAKSYPYVLCRVRLPGGVYLQARFNSKESLETIYQVFGQVLSIEAGVDGQFCHNFELFMAPPTRVLSQDSTQSLEDSNILAPACVLHLRWKSGEAGLQTWAQNFEERLSRATMDGSALPRVPYSSRFDVPEAISSRRPQELPPAEEGADDDGSESESAEEAPEQ